MKKYLEEIADKLLEGTIASEKANDLVRNFKINATKTTKNAGTILEQDNFLTFYLKGNKKSCIEFYIDKNNFNETYLFLQYVESYNPGKGYFKCLFNKLESLASKKGVSCILLEVDSKNDLGISIYEHLGFYSLGPINTVSENTDRIFMRKDLHYEE